MFDFAITGRPILFFTYDLDRYRDSVRGFYFDFVPEAPGPVVSTAERAARVGAAGPAGEIRALRGLPGEVLLPRGRPRTDRLLSRLGL